MANVVIDPGHGGEKDVDGSSSNNAQGPRGTLEKTLTLDVAMRVATILGDAGHSIWLTREADTNLGLMARATVAKDKRADVFLSIHFNASKQHNAQGTETLVHFNRIADSARLASCVQGRVQQVVGSRDRGVKQQKLGVLNAHYHLQSTACALLEVSFLDRADEEVRLQDPTYLQEIAQSAADGIELFLASKDNWGSPAYEPQTPFINSLQRLFFIREAHG